MKPIEKSIGTDRDGNKLYREDLISGVNLSGADLREANLSGVDLSGVDLRGANLSGADLRGANLSGADLRGANLRWANLNEANLREADLRGANLSGADLLGANFDFSILPLFCGSFDMKVDDRFVWQLICHITRLAQDNMSDKAKKAIEKIMPYADRFCEYRNDVKKI